MRRMMSLAVAAVVCAAMAAGGRVCAHEPPGKPAPGPQAGPEAGDHDKGARPAAVEKDFAGILVAALELSPEQKNKVAKTIEKSKPKLDAMESELHALQDKMRREMFEMKEEIRQSLSTMEQKERFDDMMSTMMGGIGTPGGGAMASCPMGRRGPGRGERIRKIIRVKADRHGTEEEIEIEDDGPGMPPGGPQGRREPRRP